VYLPVAVNFPSLKIIKGASASSCDGKSVSAAKRLPRKSRNNDPM
jgi:hypothetical protein